MTLVLRRLFGERHAHTGEQPTKIAVIARHRRHRTSSGHRNACFEQVAGPFTLAGLLRGSLGEPMTAMTRDDGDSWLRFPFSSPIIPGYNAFRPTHSTCLGEAHQHHILGEGEFAAALVCRLWRNGMADERAEKNKAIDLALAQIEKQFGKGSIMRLGNKEAIVPISVISTGSISFDAALGVGGFPRGRVVEVFGPESSGKTTIALQVIAEAQKQGGMAAFVDAEHALDPIYAKKLGVDVDNLLVSQPDYGEQALEIAEALVRSSAIDVLVVDSVAALVPKAELEGEMGDSHMCPHARLISEAW